MQRDSLYKRPMRKDLKGKVIGDWNQQEIKTLMLQLVDEPDNFQVLTRLGRLHFTSVNHPIAFRYLQQAEIVSADLNPSGKPDFDVVMAFAELHMIRGEHAKSRFRYKDALSIDKESKEALAGKRTAEEALNLNRSCEKPDFDTLMASAKIHMIRGEHAQSRFRYMDALAIDKGSKEALAGKRAAEEALNVNRISQTVPNEVLRILYPESKRCFSGEERVEERQYNELNKVRFAPG